MCQASASRPTHSIQSCCQGVRSTSAFWQAVLAQIGAILEILLIVVQDSGILQVAPKHLVVGCRLDEVLACSGAVEGGLEDSQLGEIPLRRVEDVALPLGIPLEKELAL